MIRIISYTYTIVGNIDRQTLLWDLPKYWLKYSVLSTQC